MSKHESFPVTSDAGRDDSGSVDANSTNASPCHEEQVPRVKLEHHAISSRYITAEFPPIGGVLRSRPEDFLVEEIPLFQPCGEGEHVYIMVEKQDLSTFDLIDLIAAHFRVDRNSVGFAGLKDKHAITRQVLSVHTPGKKPEDAPMLVHDRVRILWADLHTHKLRRGNLVGNRFSIRVRGVRFDSALQASKQMALLSRSGVPNRFGPQRFGHLNNNHLVGQGMVLSDWQGAVDALVGPSEAHPRPQAEGRSLYAQGEFAEAASRFPRHLRAEQQVLRSLSKGMSPRKAFRSIDRRARAFYLSAFQSALFNRVLEERVAQGTWNQPVVGDVLMRFDDRSEHVVTEDNLAESCEQCRLMLASPTGPMWGGRSTRARGTVDELETRLLAEAGLTPQSIEEYARNAGEVYEGSRRPLHIPVIDPQVEGGVDGFGAYLRCAFELPRGSFATVVLDELMKNGAPDAVTET